MRLGGHLLEEEKERIDCLGHHRPCPLQLQNDLSVTVLDNPQPPPSISPRASTNPVLSSKNTFSLSSPRSPHPIRPKIELTISESYPLNHIVLLSTNKRPQRLSSKPGGRIKSETTMADGYHKTTSPLLPITPVGRVGLVETMLTRHFQPENRTLFGGKDFLLGFDFMESLSLWEGWTGPLSGKRKRKDSWADSSLIALDKRIHVGSDTDSRFYGWKRAEIKTKEGDRDLDFTDAPSSS